jgi:hypothetical protein
VTTKKPDPLSDITGLMKVVDEQGTITALETQYVWRTFRYLFDGGKTVDVVAINDNSDLRSWVLKVTGYPGIVGCTIVEGSDE